MFTSSIGKKVVMSVTGVFLCIFLVTHLAGNLLLFKDDGGTAFNQYSGFMSTNWVVRLIEILLLFSFLFHVIDALVLTFENRKARPVKYELNNPWRNSSWVSRNMGLTGSIVLIFLLVHLNTFFVTHRILDAQEPMYRSVRLAFENPFYSLFYVVAMMLLALHLNHGFQSAFQSLGLNHERCSPLLRKVGLVFSIIIPLGFAAMPVYFYVKQFM